MNEIKIAGGGLAGLSAAILLAKAGKRVIVYEKKHYPCVKLCGEFLSHEGYGVLKGIASAVSANHEQEFDLALALRRLSEFAWISRRGQVLSMTLDPKGWAVRRDVLDPWLAKLAQSVGAEVNFGKSTQDANLWATGKEHDGLKSRYFAVKGYCSDQKNVLQSRDIVLYQLQGGYIGFTKMAGGELSYCALLDRTKVQSDWKYTKWAQLCSGIFESNPTLLGWAHYEDSLLEHHVGAARFDFSSRSPVRDGRWYVGDAVQLVPPFVGDGMAMAVEGGALAARGVIEGWSDTQYAQAWARTFKTRLRVANTLHPMLWWEGIHEPALAVLKRMPGASHWLYRSTRGLGRVRLIA